MKEEVEQKLRDIERSGQHLKQQRKALDERYQRQLRNLDDQSLGLLHSRSVFFLPRCTCW